MNTTRKAPAFESSTDRRILANVLEKKMVKEDIEFVSYQELNAAIGRDVQNHARYLLNGARKDFTRDHHILTVCVRNEGVRRSNDPSGCLDQKVKHIRRVAKQGVKQAMQVLANPKIDTEQQRGLITRMAQFGAIGQFSTGTAQKQIAGRIDEKAPQQLALLPTIDAVREQFAGKTT